MADDAAMQVPDNADAKVLNSAIQIRSELHRLVPADAEALGAELDEHIARVKAASAAKRLEYLDGLIEILISREQPGSASRSSTP